MQSRKQDRAAGRTGTANPGCAGEVVRDLNAREGRARYQEIPLKDLVR